MLLIAFHIAVIAGIILLTQYLWARKQLRGEAARKFAHMAIGSFVATWTLYASYDVIQATLLLTLFGVLFVRVTNVAPSLSDVKRSTVGDVLAPVVILLVALLEPTRTVFSVVVLHIALADGLAALIGSRFGHKRSYNIARQKKSLLGTLTFFVVSVCIMAIAVLFQPAVDASLLIMYLLVVPFVTTIFENISPYGLDNVTVPLAVFVLLSV